ncbi:MAG: hypothetical protein E7563_05975 [Ruminococcaceae bacterium]|nr:hypothetical protein [Oscillospiraceae bacterium]
MKRLLSVLLTLLLIFSIAACGSGAGGGKTESKIDPAVTGVWYGPDNIPYLNILEDGTGTCAYLAKAVEAKFTTEGNIFTVDCTEYCLSGKYEVKDNRLIVNTEYENEVYTVIFTREKFVISEELKGTHIYTIDDKAYEIHLEFFTSYVKELPFPPSAEYSETEIHITPGITDGNPGNTLSESETETITAENLHINKKPPVKFFFENTYPNTEAEATTSNGEEITENKNETNTENKKAETEKPKNNDDLPVPERVFTENGEVKIVVDGNTYTATKGGNSIVGTWTSQKMEGTSYIFGYVGDFDYTITYTFNADGTGTVTALFFTGTLTWSLTGNRLDLTISMLGDTESGSCYVTTLGDVMYLENFKGELFALSKAG